eukprot:395232-Prorocentrum_minimum.AAC.1
MHCACRYMTTLLPRRSWDGGAVVVDALAGGGSLAIPLAALLADPHGGVWGRLNVISNPSDTVSTVRNSP